MKLHTIKANIFILLTAGIISAFLIGEFACRACNFFKNSSSYMQVSSSSKLGVEPRPNVEYVNKFGILKKLNSTGFEGPELSNINNDYFKIIFLGDSIIEEAYLPVEQRIPALLQKKISKAIGKKVAVWNAGVGGYNSWQISEVLKDKVFNYHPDLVIIGICQNDFVETLPGVHKFFGRIFLNMRDGSRARIFNWFYQRSELYKFVYDRLANLYRLKIGKNGYEKYLKNYSFNISEREWASWNECIKETALSAKEKGVNTMFVIFPLHSQVVQSSNAILQKLDRFFIEERYGFINLPDSFKSANDAGIFLYREYDIIHFNKNGAEIAAEAIFNYLQQKRYLYGERLI